MCMCSHLFPLTLTIFVATSSDNFVLIIVIIIILLLLYAMVQYKISGNFWLGRSLFACHEELIR